MKCPNCGKEIANDSTFCEFCGAKVNIQSEKPMMSFGESISTCFSKYATFSGRATRAEYWWFGLLCFLIGIGAGIIDLLAGTGQVVTRIAQLAILLPGIAVGVRRCHDTNHSGWWILCPIYNLVLMFLPSDPGANDYEA